MDTWRVWAAEKGVGFLNLFSLFQSLGAPRDVLASYFIPFDDHWNENGHEVVAKALCAELASGWTGRLNCGGL